MSLFRSLYLRLREIHFRLSRNEVIVIFAAGVFVILTGTLVYAWLEGWSLLDSLYATVITVTTVGYGDVSPQTPGGRLFAVFFTLLAVGVAGYAISVLAASVIERQSTKLERILRKKLMNRIDNLNEHIIVCGCDFVGSRVALEYRRTRTPFILVEASEDLLRQTLLLLIPEYYQATLEAFSHAKGVDLAKFEVLSLLELGEATRVAFLNESPLNDNVLWRAGIERAAGLLTTLPDDRDNLAVVIGARALARQSGNKGLRIMSRVEDVRNIRKLYFSGVDEVRTPGSIGGAEMALHLTNPEIGKWWYGRFSEDSAKGHFHQVVVAKDRPAWIEKTVADIQATESLLILALKRADQYLSPPPQNAAVQRDDVAITFR
jgi:voltage-gated potassium channel